MLIFFVLASSSPMIFAEPIQEAGYYERFNQSLSSIKQSIYNGMTFVWNLPAYIKAYFSKTSSPLVAHVKMELDGKPFEGFWLNISQDSNEIKQLRKKLSLSGIYFADGSDIAIYEKLRSTLPSEQQYIENGFSIDKDNSVSACMFRLLNDMIAMNQRKAINSEELNIYLKLLWELDSTLPASFDSDSNGDTFIDFAKKMMSHAKNTSINISVQEILSDWKRDSHRFNKNIGLQKAIERVSNPV